MSENIRSRTAALRRTPDLPVRPAATEQTELARQVAGREAQAAAEQRTRRDALQQEANRRAQDVNFWQPGGGQ